MKATITIHPGVSYGTIAPDIYGHFAEHLGRCIYEGLWVGEDSPIPNEGGVRNDVVEVLAAINPPVLRWPGGCFADMYHWQDGIGPREDRPQRPNLWWEGVDSNEFGTDEFLRTCQRIGTEPYVCINVGTGTPEEATAWLEYCNYPGDTTITRMRTDAGRDKPWGVKWWAIGNENWGCGGWYTPEDYAKEFRRYSCFLAKMDPEAQLVACGHTETDWNPRMFEELKNSHAPVHHLSIHRYTNGGSGTGFTEDEYWLAARGIPVMETDILAAAGAVAAYARDGGKIGIILDEWGMWHSDTKAGLFQANTLRDALFAAASFNMFHRHCDVLTMANLAQTINVLQCLVVTDKDKMALTPTYHVFDMFQPHMGAQAIVANVECDSAEVGDDVSIPLVDVSASRADDGSLTISAVNWSLDTAIDTVITLPGVTAKQTDAKTLTGDAPNLENQPGLKPIIEPVGLDCTVENGCITCTLPPVSVALFRVVV